jgi:hypothetical protein
MLSDIVMIEEHNLPCLLWGNEDHVGILEPVGAYGLTCHHGLRVHLGVN